MFKKLIETDHIVAGITVKNSTLAEQGNMALHICEDEEAIIANREKLAKAIGVSLRQFVCANQTHSDHFYEVTNSDAGRGAFTTADAIVDVDALYTFADNIVLTSFTADCVPIIFYNETSKLIGAIHSGWKGTVQSITEKVFIHLRDEKGVQLSNMNVHIGTCLSQHNFEVDNDVASQFRALQYADEYIYYDESKNKYFIDNQAVVRMQCIRAGILPEKITTDLTCTMDAADGFSYREHKRTGRHVTFIMQK